MFIKTKKIVKKAPVKKEAPIQSVKHVLSSPAAFRAMLLPIKGK